MVHNTCIRFVKHFVTEVLEDKTILFHQKSGVKNVKKFRDAYYASDAFRFQQRLLVLERKASDFAEKLHFLQEHSLQQERKQLLQQEMQHSILYQLLKIHLSFFQAFN